MDYNDNQALSSDFFYKIMFQARYVYFYNTQRYNVFWDHLINQ